MNDKWIIDYYGINALVTKQIEKLIPWLIKLVSWLMGNFINKFSN